MEARVKAIRWMILSSANLETFEDCNERKGKIDQIYSKKKDVFDFSEEMKEESSEDKSPPKIEAKCSNSDFKGKYFYWFETPFEQTFTRLSSVPNFSAKGKGAAENVSSAIEAWSLLFSDDLLNIILKYTNEELERTRSRRQIECYFRMLDMVELKAFIGLLYYASLQEKNNFWLDRQKKRTFVSKCFSAHGLPLFRATMAMCRFLSLLVCLQFDDETMGSERFENDYFTCIRGIWNLFVKNCIRYYEPGYNVTIDEYSLDVFSSDVSHKQYEKFFIMNDSDTFYMINAISYTVNVGSEPLKSYYIRKISEPIHNTCRNITCSNSSLTSVPLVDTMHEKFSLTMIGSLRKDKPYVPLSFKRAPTEIQVYQYNKTLMSYKSENDEMVLLLSSLHLHGKINEVEKKSEIISYYNKTKGASNKFLQLCHEYAVGRKLNLSIRMFNHMLEQAVVNSFVLYTLNANNQVITRNKFLLELSMALIKPFLIKHLSRPNLHISVQCRLKFFLDEQDLPEEDSRNLRLDISNRVESRRGCCFCPISKRKNTKLICLKCNNSMCKIHKASICQNCAKNQFFNHLP